MKLTKNITRWIGVIGIMTLVCSSYPIKVQAQDEESMAGEPLQVGGVVKSVDTKDNKLVIEHRGKDKVMQPMTFTVTSDTQIKRDDRPVAFKDIKIGDKVGVEYTKDGNQMTAQEILLGLLVKRGVVKTIDTKRLTLDTQGHTMNFTLASDIKVVHGKTTTGALTDVKPGEKVMVIYNEDGNKNVAHEIRTPKM